MSKLIEMGIFTDGWGIKARRVGKDAFVALISSERAGTNPIVVIRKESVGLAQLPGNVKDRSGCWTRLSETTYALAEKSPVVVYGGEGPFTLTPNRILTAYSYQEVIDVKNALGRMMSRSVGFARAVTKAA